jgi:hypothetical protein
MGRGASGDERGKLASVEKHAFTTLTVRKFARQVSSWCTLFVLPEGRTDVGVALAGVQR